MAWDGIYDAVFIGGGPAGLAVASELCMSHKVLVVEREEAGKTKRSWFVPPFCINDEIKPFTYGGVKRYLADTFSGAKISWDCKLYGAYPYIDEKKILPYWKDKIMRHGSMVLNNCEFQDYFLNNGIVTVRTSKGDAKGRLLVDASGHDSKIIKKNHLENKSFYWWSIYGAIAKHKNGLAPTLKVGDYMLWQTFRDTNAHVDTSLREGRPVFEYEILTADTSFPLILYLRKEKMDKDYMDKEFMHILRQEASTAAFHDVEIDELKYGWYPSGGLTQRVAADHVAFIGDAGCWTTPCGWGMGFILNNYRIYAKHLANSINNKRFDAASLTNIPDLKVHDKYEILFDKLMTHFLSNAPAEMLDQFIGFFKIIDPIICEKIFTLTVSQKECLDTLKVFLKHIPAKDLIKVLPREDYITVMEEAKYFVEDAVKDKLHGFLDILKGGKPHPALEDGFSFD
ncbi:MAG: hypothetical protein HZA04_10940 [Nitrospinae bacterium]|nr:hypothetical protein [Nitrospinota bacterium]